MRRSQPSCAIHGELEHVTGLSLSSGAGHPPLAAGRSDCRCAGPWRLGHGQDSEQRSHEDRGVAQSYDWRRLDPAADARPSHCAHADHASSGGLNRELVAGPLGLDLASNALSRGAGLGRKRPGHGAADRLADDRVRQRWRPAGRFLGLPDPDRPLPVFAAAGGVHRTPRRGRALPYADPEGRLVAANGLWPARFGADQPRPRRHQAALRGDPMNYLLPAQASAQLLSLIVFGAIARWYAVPWLKRRPRADALIALLWVHVFRYVALQVFSAQRDGFPISDGGAMEIVVGDVAGAFMAFVTIALVRRGMRLAIPLAWLLVAETTYDTVSNIHGGVREHLMGAASGVTWFVLVFFVPMVVISVALLVWQLYSRRSEAIDSAAGDGAKAYEAKAHAT